MKSHNITLLTSESSPKDSRLKSVTEPLNVNIVTQSTLNNIATTIIIIKETQISESEFDKKKKKKRRGIKRVPNKQAPIPARTKKRGYSLIFTQQRKLLMNMIEKPSKQKTKEN